MFSSGDSEYSSSVASHIRARRPHRSLGRVWQLSAKHGSIQFQMNDILSFFVSLIKCKGETGGFYLRHEVVDLGQQRHHQRGELAQDPQECCQVKILPSFASIPVTLAL